MKRSFGRTLAGFVAAGLLLAALPMDAAALLDPGVSTVKPWDQLDLYEQYSSFIREECTYSVQPVELTAEQVGDALGNVTTVGVDNRMVRFTHPAQIFGISGFHNKCAVAVRYGGDSRYFVSTNRDYTPSTLGSLITDLSLSENLVLGEVTYTYWKDNVQKKGNQITERYTLADDSAVWDILLSDKTLAAVRTLPNPLVGVMTAAVQVKEIGAQDATISVTTDGYMIIYVLGSGKGFFPGKQVTQKFIQYVEQNGTMTGRTAGGDDAPASGESLLGAKSVIQ